MQTHRSICFIVLCLLLVAMFITDICFGSVSMRISDVWAALSGQSTDEISREIILNLRLPRAITAVIAGIALSVAGLLMQTLFRNPLADPYILGVSSGATFGVAMTIMAGTLTGVYVTSQWATATAAVCGASVVLLIVLAVSFKIRDSISLLIVGIMLSSIAGALVNIIQNYSNPDALKLFIVWTLGSLSAVSWQQMGALLAMVVPGLIIAFALIKTLNGLLLSENYARSLGISIPLTRFLIILATGLMAGGVTAFTGPIAFVGVAVPHIARGLLQSANHRSVMPCTALCGANLLLICDLISKTTTHNLPISTVSALFGAPVIIWIILNQKHQ